jgi:hypothetical protein
MPFGATDTATMKSRPSAKIHLAPRASDRYDSVTRSRIAARNAARRTERPPSATQINTSAENAKPIRLGLAKASVATNSAPASPATAPPRANAVTRSATTE